MQSFFDINVPLVKVIHPEVGWVVEVDHIYWVVFKPLSLSSAVTFVFTVALPKVGLAKVPPFIEKTTVGGVVSSQIAYKVTFVLIAIKYFLSFLLI